jgi:hypothetical protein
MNAAEYQDAIATLVDAAARVQELQALRYARHYALVRDNRILVDKATGLLEIYEHQEQAVNQIQPNSEVVEVCIARSPETLQRLNAAVTPTALTGVELERRWDAVAKLLLSLDSLPKGTHE